VYRSSRADRRNIELRTDTERVLVNADTAIYCGLIINELMSNALRHGFPQGGPGTITVAVHATLEGLVLRVADDGVGLPPGLDYHDTETLGLQLVAMLTDQLSGRLELDRETGTAFTLTLPGIAWTRPEDHEHA
jgi:two-component sensor histidine kinase